jgi:excisionase family DNA binding protein
VKKLLTIEQASGRTELTQKAIRMKIWRGEFPYARIGKRIFIPEDELERFISLTVKKTAEEAASKVEAALR